MKETIARAECLFTLQAINERLEQIAAQLNQDYVDKKTVATVRHEWRCGDNGTLITQTALRWRRIIFTPAVMEIKRLAEN